MRRRPTTDDDPMNDLLHETTRRALLYVSNANRRRVAPAADQIALLEKLAGPLPGEPTEPREVLALLDDYGSPATVASTG